jgi:hypothetical protein
MEAACFSEISVEFQCTTSHYIPEDENSFIGESTNICHIRVFTKIAQQWATLFVRTRRFSRNGERHFLSSVRPSHNLEERNVLVFRKRCRFLFGACLARILPEHRLSEILKGSNIQKQFPSGLGPSPSFLKIRRLLFGNWICFLPQLRLTLCKGPNREGGFPLSYDDGIRSIFQSIMFAGV